MNQSTKVLLVLAFALSGLPVANYLANRVLANMVEHPQQMLAFDLIFTGLIICGGIISLLLIRLFQLPLPGIGRPVSGILTGVLVGFGSIPIVGLANLLIRGVDFGAAANNSPLQSIQNTGAESLQLDLLYFVIVAPFTEELTFRALLAQQANKAMSQRYALLVSSVTFALFHGLVFNWGKMQSFLILDFLPLFIAGLIFGMAYFRHGIWAAIVAHMIFNAKNYCEAFLTKNSLAFVAIAFVGAIVICLLFVSQFKGVKHEH
jgi:membrane protease YdiL (CAAX protease family)